jgi:hypothetical protein
MGREKKEKKKKKRNTKKQVRFIVEHVNDFHDQDQY